MKVMIIVLSATLAATSAFAATARHPMVLAQTTPPAPEVCAMVYQPVCARTASGEMKTFGNACEARRDGATVVSEGPCEVKK